MSLNHSYVPDYLSITDILVTEERVITKMKTRLPRLGFLDVTTKGRDLQEGTKLELPFWLAHPLHERARPIISIDLPKFYKEGYREILRANASAVNLTNWNRHYYEFGMCLRRFKNPECEKITDSLIETFKFRRRWVMDLAQNPMFDPMVGSQLPTLEAEIFLAGRRAKENLIDWLNKGDLGIKTSETAENIRKRHCVDFNKI